MMIEFILLIIAIFSIGVFFWAAFLIFMDLATGGESETAKDVMMMFRDD